MGDLIVLLAALSSLSVVIMLWYALLPADSGARRVKALADQRKAIRAGIMGPIRRKKSSTKPASNFMHDIVSRMKLLSSTQSQKVQRQLMKAGWRSKDAIVRYYFFKLALPPVFGIIAVACVYVLQLWPMEDMAKALSCIGAVVGGLYAPDIFVKNKAAKRQDTIRKALPDALDLMVICAEAGLSLDATLGRVSREMERTAPELSDEFTLTSLELGFSSDRRQALKNMALRSDVSVLRGMVNTLLQSEKYGTPLANSLRVMSAESREERMMKAEEKAARLPAMMTVPMIVFILPPLFVVLIGPAILKTMDALKNF